MRKDLKHLSSLPFMAGLFLLLLNDFWFKEVFHNSLTGKLSDFCGLFVFSIFWSVMLPKKKPLVFFATALLFIFWKSPYSSGLIKLFSNYLYPIARVVDLTDLTALAILPIAWQVLDIQFRRLYFNPSILGLLTIFSFCATSAARPEQHFEQPQYVLFETSEIPTFGLGSALDFFEQEDLLAIKVNYLDLTMCPAKDDDFQKNLIIRDLDKRILLNLTPAEKLLLKTPEGNHSLVFDFNNYKDIASFKGNRLDGRFQRIKNDGTVLIDGSYKGGFEDSVWTIRDTVTGITVKKTFVNGETTRSELFEAGKLISSASINTRKEIVRDKYFQLAFLGVLAFGLILLIYKNLKINASEKIHLPIVLKLLLALTLPLAVIFFHLMLNAAIPNSYSDPLARLGGLLLIYAGSVPLFLLVFLVIKIGKQLDILLYTLLIAILFTFWQEILQLERLMTAVI